MNIGLQVMTELFMIAMIKARKILTQAIYYLKVAKN